MQKYVELNQDIYANVIEQRGMSNYKVVSFGNKLTRYSEPKYSDAFMSTSRLNWNEGSIDTVFTHDDTNNRKMQIKIGKITDTSILNKIKNKDANGFENLLSYAKTNSGIYNQTKNSNSELGIGYESESTDRDDIINLKGIENGEYYFLYVKTDDENGKYVSNEAVTFAQAAVDDSGWWLFFFGTDDFKWSDFGESNTEIKDNGKKDDTTVPDKKMPQTGTNAIYIAVGIATIMLAGASCYVIYRKNNY